MPLTVTRTGIPPGRAHAVTVRDAPARTSASAASLPVPGRAADVVDRRQPVEVRGGDHAGRLGCGHARAAPPRAPPSRTGTGEQAPDDDPRVGDDAVADRPRPPPPTTIEITRYAREPSFANVLRAPSSIAGTSDRGHQLVRRGATVAR